MSTLTKTVGVKVDVLREAIVQGLKHEGHVDSSANIIADVLMFAELRLNSQGIIKLVTGALKRSDNEKDITTLFETPVSAQIDGGNQSGMVVVAKAVDMAIEKATKTGISVVGANGYASATGALGYWAKHISQKGYVSIVMSQCPEMVAPHGSFEPIFGTNPLAIGVPRTIPAELPTLGTIIGVGEKSTISSSISASESLPPVVLDMATSAYAWYAIKSAEENNEKIPGDVAWDVCGNPTTDPAAALGGALRSFDRSYKGSHLGLMVELLAGAFTGAAMNDKKEQKNWGTVVLVLHPNVLGDQDGFIQRVKEMCDRVHGAKPLPDTVGKPHYLPGERGDEITEKHLKEGVLQVPEEVYAKLLTMNKY